MVNASMIQQHADQICDRICDADMDGKLSVNQIRQKVVDRLIAMGHDEAKAKHAAKACI